MRYETETVTCRGRWRHVKPKLRALAAELGWPECLAVAHEDQVEGHVLRVGARLASWRKLSRLRGRPADRAAERRRRKARRAYDPDGIPF